MPKEVESRARPPKEVRAINKWLGVGQNSNILKNILKIAQAVRQSRKNKQNIAGMYTSMMKVVEIYSVVGVNH